MKTQPNLYYTVVIEDTATKQVVGSATLVKEMHFIRQCASVSTVMLWTQIFKKIYEKQRKYICWFLYKCQKHYLVRVVWCSFTVSCSCRTVALGKKITLTWSVSIIFFFLRIYSSGATANWWLLSSLSQCIEVPCRQVWLGMWGILQAKLWATVHMAN
jgi:hypothetical protein